MMEHPLSSGSETSALDERFARLATELAALKQLVIGEALGAMDVPLLSPHVRDAMAALAPVVDIDHLSRVAAKIVRQNERDQRRTQRVERLAALSRDEDSSGESRVAVVQHARHRDGRTRLVKLVTMLPVRKP